MYMYMQRTACEITGLRPLSNQEHTHNEFKKIINAAPTISLDEAILVFENAPPHISLDEFATSKQRSADGYRLAFSTYFYSAHDNQSPERPTAKKALQKFS